jgi:hypothetical protein
MVCDWVLKQSTKLNPVMEVCKHKPLNSSSSSSSSNSFVFSFLVDYLTKRDNSGSEGDGVGSGGAKVGCIWEQGTLPCIRDLTYYLALVLGQASHVDSTTTSGDAAGAANADGGASINAVDSEQGVWDAPKVIFTEVLSRLDATGRPATREVVLSKDTTTLKPKVQQMVTALGLSVTEGAEGTVEGCTSILAGLSNKQRLACLCAAVGADSPHFATKLNEWMGWEATTLTASSGGGSAAPTPAPCVPAKSASAKSASASTAPTEAVPTEVVPTEAPPPSPTSALGGSFNSKVIPVLCLRWLLMNFTLTITEITALVAQIVCTADDHDFLLQPRGPDNPWRAGCTCSKLPSTVQPGGDVSIRRMQVTTQWHAVLSDVWCLFLESCKGSNYTSCCCCWVRGRILNIESHACKDI